MFPLRTEHHAPELLPRHIAPLILARHRPPRPSPPKPASPAQSPIAARPATTSYFPRPFPYNVRIFSPQDGTMKNYLLFTAFHAPWLLLLAGALPRMRRRVSRYRALQLLGAAILLAGVLLRFALYDTRFGFDPWRVKTWTAIAEYVERGAFGIGLLAFGLGYFLERRPTPALRPWHPIGKTIAALSILLCAGLAVLTARNVSFPWLDSPWPEARLVFTLGFYPFACGYALRGITGEDTYPRTPPTTEYTP